MSKEETKLSMNINGHSKVPPGFRFHPTEEELLHYYLMKKVAYQKIDLDVIQEVDLNKFEPWEIQEKCNIGSNMQNDWYFFSHKDKKYPTGTRTNRSTSAGFWKATGRDKVIRSSLQRTGMRKTLVFYKGRAPHGQKSDWIMYEYRLDDIIIPIQDSKASNLSDNAHEEGWVVCRLFKKKTYHKSFKTPQRSLSGSMENKTQCQLSNNKDDKYNDVFGQLLVCMDGRSCKQDTENFTMINDASFHLPRLESPTMSTSPRMSLTTSDQGLGVKNYDSMCTNYDWANIDKLLAFQLDGQMEQTKHFSSCYGDSDDEKFCFSVDQP